MSKQSGSRSNSLDSNKKDVKFDVVIIGNYDIKDSLFIKTFPIEKASYRHKYLSRYDLILRETIMLPQHFKITHQPELFDKLKKIDILILAYIATDELSFENLKTFYYLYYLKMDENDRPKNIILIERDYWKDDLVAKVDQNSAKKLAKLFNGYFYDCETNENDLNLIFNEFLEKLLSKYSLNNDFSLFKFKEFNNEVKCFMQLYGDKDSQNTFLNLLLKSKCNFDYKQIKDNFYEVKYVKTINGIPTKFQILLKLIKIEYYYDSECNILLYNQNENESYSLIKKIIRLLIKNNGAKFKKIYNLFSLNPNLTPNDENDEKIMQGKNIASEIGANFSVLNINKNNNNISEEIKNKFDNILEQIIDFINKSKTHTDNQNEDTERKNSSLKPDNNDDLFIDLNEEEEEMSFVNTIKNRIKMELSNNPHCLLNICQVCHNQLNIKIDETSNIIMLYCNECKLEPKGINIDQLFEINSQKEKKFYCQKCKNIFNYDFTKRRLYCDCEGLNRKSSKGKKTQKDLDNIQVPVYLQECFCPLHHHFHQYYYKYSKKGLCQTCLTEKNENNYYIENFSEEYINNLIKEKKEEFDKEKKVIKTIVAKFNECLQLLQIKFNKYMDQKIKMNKLKLDMINSLQILHNNYTLISNVKSLTFDVGENLNYNENDSIEKKIQSIFNYFKYESYVDHLYFGNKKIVNDIVDLSGPHSLITEENNKDITTVTDIGSLKNNELVCISFNDGNARIYDSNELGKNNYPYCLIKAFNPCQGVNSLYISKNEDSIWKTSSIEKNELIYLNGYEEIKIVQMHDDYKSYEILYTIKNENNNVINSIELDNNQVLLLNTCNYLQLATISKDNSFKFKDTTEDINYLLVDHDKSPISLRKISKNVICLELINSEDELQIVNANGDFTILDPTVDNNEEKKSFRDTINEEDIFNNLNGASNKKSNNFNNNNGTFLVDNKEKFTKLIFINLNSDINRESIKNDENGNENVNNCALNIKNEYIFPKNYQFLGNISEESNLFLINYNYFFCIFDFNNCQFTHVFTTHNIETQPKYFIQYNYNCIIDKKGFVLMNEDFSFVQYFYNDDYENKMYYFNKVTTEKKDKKLTKNILGLKNKIIVLYDRNNYYLLNN